MYQCMLDSKACHTFPISISCTLCPVGCFALLCFLMLDNNLQILVLTDNKLDLGRLFFCKIQKASDEGLRD